MIVWLEVKLRDAIVQPFTNGIDQTFFQMSCRK